MSNEYGKRYYIIVSVSELANIDFTQVLQTSAYTARKSVNKTKALIEWNGDIVPICIENIETKEGPYTIEEMREIISSPEWSPPLKK